MELFIETLLESELFGHRKGAFTGANENKLGVFQLADRSTLFLDEVGEMSPEMQKKLLRVLQDGEIRPVGAKDHYKVDVRIIAATNKDLQMLMQQGRFSGGSLFSPENDQHPFSSFPGPQRGHSPSDSVFFSQHYGSSQAATQSNGKGNDQNIYGI